MARVLTRVFLLICTLTSVALADSYTQPDKLQSKSANRQFEARTTPGTGNQTARLSVHRAGDDKPTWTAQLTNPISPADVAIANTGNHVMTFDNWARNGYGDDVIAFYKSGALVKKYSLEQILNADTIPLDHPAVGHTASSRIWRYNAISFIEQLDPKSGRAGPNYVIWLAATDQWLAWSMDTGDKLAPPDDQLRRWENTARTQVIEQLRADRPEPIAFQFLARLRRPKDRARIEKRLQSTEFVHGSAVTRYNDKQEQLLELVSQSQFREAADQALARWDNQTPTDKGFLLGELHGTLQLPAIDPPPDKSILHIYLIPDSIPADNWSTAPLTHRIGRKLSPQIPLVNNRLDFRFRHVLAGRYWIKAVYDTAKPFASEDSVCAAGDGDFESAPTGILEVSAGQTTESPALSCNQRSP